MFGLFKVGQSSGDPPAGDRLNDLHRQVKDLGKRMDEMHAHFRFYFIMLVTIMAVFLAAARYAP